MYKISIKLISMLHVSSVQATAGNTQCYLSRRVTCL